MRGGLIGTGRYVEGKYHVKLIVRDGMGQTSDDYHATVTRLSDDAQLVYISDWKWILKLRTRRRALDRAFKRMEKREKKLAETEETMR